MPANTPSQYYLDTPASRPTCDEDFKTRDRKCTPDKEPDKAKPPGLARRIRSATGAFDALGRQAARYRRRPPNAWIDSHCDGLWFKPLSLDSLETPFGQNLTEALEGLKAQQRGLLKEALVELGELAVEQAGEAATRKLAGLGARSVAKNLLGGLVTVGSAGVGAAVEAGMLAWTLADVLGTARELAALAGPQGGALMDVIDELGKLDTTLDKILKDYQAKPSGALADSMELLAKFNPCLRARKCRLVPFKEIQGQSESTSAIKQARSGKGCCPGQTGHHVLPGAMFKGTNCGYRHNDAPTMCLEGATNGHGSHGKAHRALDVSIREYKDDGGGETISYKEAKKQGLDAVAKAGASHCNPRCLEVQLDAFYDNCNQGDVKNLRANSGMGGRTGGESRDIF